MELVRSLRHCATGRHASSEVFRSLLRIDCGRAEFACHGVGSASATAANREVCARSPPWPRRLLTRFRPRRDRPAPRDTEVVHGLAGLRKVGTMLGAVPGPGGGGRHGLAGDPKSPQLRIPELPLDEGICCNRPGLVFCTALNSGYPNFVVLRGYYRNPDSGVSRSRRRRECRCRYGFRCGARCRRGTRPRRSP